MLKTLINVCCFVVAISIAGVVSTYFKNKYLKSNKYTDPTLQSAKWNTKTVAQEVEWKLHHFANGDFHCLISSEAEVNYSRETEKIGSEIMLHHCYSALDEAKYAGLVTDYFDIGVELTPIIRNQLFQKIRDDALSRSGKIQSDDQNGSREFLFLERHPSFEFTFKTKTRTKPLVCIARIYSIESKIYIIKSFGDSLEKAKLIADSFAL